MNRLRRAGIWSFLYLAFGSLGLATSFLPISTADHIALSVAIFRGTVLSAQSYLEAADGHIYTRTVFRVDEVFKGKIPPRVKLVHRGGIAGGRGENDGFAPTFRPGEERLVFVSRRADGTLYATQGGTSALKITAATEGLLQDLRSQIVNGSLPGGDVTDQRVLSEEPAIATGAGGQTRLTGSSATNLITGGDNLPARFTVPDRGEPIPYLVDADYLPAGMSLNQALGAVQAALAAWTNACTVRYAFAGIQSFGMAAANLNATDGILRIQLHDHYNFTAGGGELGRGGQYWESAILPISGWTGGGNIDGSDFHKVLSGFIVLQHANTFMQNVTNFAEVLCHEIGHTIGLGHSSENPNEASAFLKQAIMYYTAHGNGHGAALNGWDTNVCRQVHALIQPPYCFDRVMDVVSTPAPINIAGVNTVQVRGYDLHHNALSFATADASSFNGSFSVIASNITFNPAGFYSDSSRLDPAGNASYDEIFARYANGTSASPYATIRVVSFNADSYSEGIPDTWRATYFGSPNPAIGANHHATNDADGDKVSNLVEYWLGSDPTNKNSNLRITGLSATNLQWQAKPYEVYELYRSTNLVTWSRAINPIVPTSSPGTASGFLNGEPRQFFRILKVP